MKKKRSFFEKITGSVKAEEFDDELEMEEDQPEDDRNPMYEEEDGLEIHDEPTEMGQLSVDVINQPEEIIIRAMVAGVKPHDLDVQISRDMVTITGTREEMDEIEEQDYYHRELYWGSFSRNILLPEEIDIEDSAAKEKHGLLEVVLPKIDKKKKTKLSVKSN